MVEYGLPGRGLSQTPCNGVDMERLWTLDDLARFAHHPDAAVRDWAVHRLMRLFPEQAGDILVTLLDDPYVFITRWAVDFLGCTGERERYGPVLLAYLFKSFGATYEHIALALARLDYREALPLLLERLQELSRRFPEGWGRGHYFLFQALGIFGGQEVRQALWKVANILPGDELDRTNVFLALLEAALPADVIRLVELYRSREAGRERSRYLRALAGAAEVDGLTGELLEAVPYGLGEVLESAAEWLGAIPPWSAPCLEELERAFRRKQQGIFAVLLAEARRIVAERGDDIAAWRLAWDTGIRPRGYPRRALLTLLILEALASHPHPYPKLRDHESALGLALLAALSLDRDDEAWLERAEDRTAALLEILLSDREHVLPDVIEQVVALGPAIAPRLIAALDPAADTWGMIRLVRAIEQLARRYPGSCDAAAPLLVSAIEDSKGDFILEACLDALAAIGPAAVSAIGPHLGDEDVARQIYLTGALEEIPTEEAARLVLDAIAAAGGYYDEMQVVALRGIGSRAAIEPLYRFWQAGDEDGELVETLFVLCQLHGVDYPELSEWRSRIQEAQSKLAEVAGKTLSEILGKRATEEKKSTAGRRTRHKGIGSKERRRRAAQRKEQRRRKKGKR